MWKNKKPRWGKEDGASLNHYMSLLHHTHYKCALYITDIFNFTQAVHMKIIIAIHVLFNNLQHKIKLTGNIITFDHFIHLIDSPDEFCTGRFIMLLQRNIADHH